MRGQNNWFGPKRFGIGISPTNWRGWVTLGIHCVLLAGGSLLLAGHGTYRELWVIGLTVALLIIAAWKYGPRSN